MLRAADPNAFSASLTDDKEASLARLVNVLKIPDLLQPRPIGGDSNLALEKWRHHANEFTVVVELMHSARCKEIVPQDHPHGAWQLSLAHEVIQLVH